MFANNKYTTWYYNIINIRKKLKPVGYSEKHHIIPLSLGGLRDRANVVRLTAREHFICHQLLVRMVTDTVSLIKMLYALARFDGTASKSRDYQLIRAARAKAASLTHKGKPKSLEQREKMRQAALHMDPSLRAQVSDSTRIKTDKTKAKMKASALAYWASDKASNRRAR